MNGKGKPRPWCIVSAGKICGRHETEAAATTAANDMRERMRALGCTGDEIEVRCIPATSTTGREDEPRPGGGSRHTVPGRRSAQAKESP
jgi:hypothetical protein